MSHDHDHDHAGHGHPHHHHPGALPHAPHAHHLRCENLTLCHGKRPAVHHLNADLTCGSFVGVVGPNGAGKTTLLNGILGWIPATSGRVTFSGQDVERCLARLTYLPQRKVYDLDFPVTVEDVVGQGRCQARGWLRGFGDDDRIAIRQAITEMGLGKLRTRPLAQLSGGQQQRVFLARAIATGADVVLLDEPLTGLDEPSAHDLLARLRAWAEGGRLVIAVIHDLEAVRRWCTHALLLNHELVACGPVREAMSEANVARCYGRPLREEGRPLREGVGA